MYFIYNLEYKRKETCVYESVHLYIFTKKYTFINMLFCLEPPHTTTTTTTTTQPTTPSSTTASTTAARTTTRAASTTHTATSRPRPDSWQEGAYNKYM